MAIDRVEDSGIIFLDEIDKIAGREGTVRFPAKACSVTFCPSSKAPQHPLWHGADRPHPVHRRWRFHVSKPSDLIPELQGRFSIRSGAIAELHSVSSPN
jgi:ATP-dependent HslUV protease ATP-binding subunit HslU